MSAEQVEESSKGYSKSRLAIIAMAFCLTAALFLVAYLARVAAHDAERDAEAAEQQAQQRLAELGGLQAHRMEVLEQMMQAGLAKQNVFSAFGSFERPELETLRTEAIEKAGLSKALLLEHDFGLWRKRLWIWIPEEGHRLRMQLKVVNMKDEYVLEGNSELQKIRRFELPVGKAHYFDFQIEERHKQKDCVLKIQFNDEIVAQKTLLLDPTRASSSNAPDKFLYIPKEMSNNWIWNEDLKDLVENKIWYQSGGRSFNLRVRKEALDPDSTSTPEPVVFSLKLLVESHSDIYALKSQKFLLEQRGLSFQPVDEPGSPYANMFRITGFQRKSGSETALPP
ncbi:MAG: hypothetical protein AAF483_19750 [Planctomycetota bacterium]